MAAFLIDEDVSTGVALLLVASGHDAVTIADLRRKGSKDEAVVWLGAVHNWIVVTHNERDFLMLHRAWHRWRVPYRHAGILVVYQSVAWRPSDIADSIREFLGLNLAVENEFFSFGRDRTWHQCEVHGAVADTFGLEPAG